MTDSSAGSPRAHYLDEARLGYLAYQIDERNGQAVFYPRVLTGEGNRELRWARSAGMGTIYSFSVIHERGGTTRNVALADMDEGFRIMTTVRGLSGDRSPIGIRGRVRMEEVNGEYAPVFEVAEGAS